MTTPPWYLTARTPRRYRASWYTRQLIMDACASSVLTRRQIAAVLGVVPHPGLNRLLTQMVQDGELIAWYDERDALRTLLYTCPPP